MKSGQPANEDEIQRMIADHPEMVTGSDDRLLLIERECSIADRTEGGGRWALDHLFVTRDARPVLVEVRIVEFLNEQMDAAVQAVELRWYVADNGTKALVPRIIGATERAASKKLATESRGPNDYWVQLKRAYPKLVQGSPWRDKQQNFFTLRSGNPTIVIGCKFVQNVLKLYAYFDYKQAKTAYSVIKSHRGQVENDFGQQLEWDDMAAYIASRIAFSLPDSDMADKEDWSRQHAWLAEHGSKLGDAIRPHLQSVEQALDTDAGQD